MNTWKRVGAVLCVAGVLGGCSMSMPLGSLFGKDEPEEVTGTTNPPAASAAPVVGVTRAPLDAPTATSAPAQQQAAAPVKDMTANAALNPTDWNYARGALGLALTGPENTPPVPWANPDTGTRGNFAPSAPAETRDGTTCRAFVANRVEKEGEVRLTGRACRTPEGHWDIAEVKTSPAT